MDTPTFTEEDRFHHLILQERKQGEEGAYLRAKAEISHRQIQIQKPTCNCPAVPWAQAGTQTTGNERGPSKGISSLRGYLLPWHPLGSLCNLLLPNFITFLLIHPLQPQHICSGCRSPTGRCAYLHSCEGFPQSSSLTT